MVLINPPRLAPQPEDTRATRVLWMVEERLMEIVRCYHGRAGSVHGETAIKEARLGLAAIRSYFAGGELPAVPGRPVGLSTKTPACNPLQALAKSALDK
jgi:hypothetical protein